MAEAGLTWVRIGEFCWSRVEPKPGCLEFEWLDHAIQVLTSQGLKIVLGTPTATPPIWVLEKHPDMLACDADGRPRKFGSRRHYCFSHPGYLAEAKRITELFARRYGSNPAIQAWQTDNEYGCHDTVRSYSNAARAAFHDWLRQRYASIDALNSAWGNVFWSMEYARFEQIDLPNLTVTEPNPAHAMDFRRFCSDQVVLFNRMQTKIIRRHSDAPILHNYMGRVTDFDHFEVGQDLDIATWDSYPMGFLEDRVSADAEHKRRYACQGDPDFQAFHHDLYCQVGHGRWWVMEQQPGPVNWAPVNPAPLPGMCRLWAWEAFAHGAETVSYFRWRQAPFAQEQMHAGLLRPDNSAAPGLAEVSEVARELETFPDVQRDQAEVALVFDYPSQWASEVQPQGSGYDYFQLIFEFYQGLRRLGLNIDIIPSDLASLEGYRLILAPGLMCLPNQLIEAAEATSATLVLGPRTGLKTRDFAIPVPLPPNIPGLDLKVTEVETFRADTSFAIDGEGGGAVKHWIEHLETSLPSRYQTTTRLPLMVGESVRYLAGWPDEKFLERILEGLLDEIGISFERVTDGLRLRKAGETLFAFNYGPEPVTFKDQNIPPAGVVMLRA